MTILMRFVDSLLPCPFLRCLATPCRRMALLSLSGMRGPESCRGMSRGSGRSCDGSVTRSEIRKASHGATTDFVEGFTQDVRAKVEV